MLNLTELTNRVTSTLTTLDGVTPKVIPATGGRPVISFRGDGYTITAFSLDVNDATWRVEYLGRRRTHDTFTGSAFAVPTAAVALVRRNR